jgi:hypothetical protein
MMICLTLLDYLCSFGVKKTKGIDEPGLYGTPKQQ